ncbi:hypothetical protein B7494_g1658 [Chlorociboria aeruginascens]|nr:hypothetical protein B7494_g1658 [Chlorociboria aeruginascens]
MRVLTRRPDSRPGRQAGQVAQLRPRSSPSSLALPPSSPSSAFLALPLDIKHLILRALPDIRSLQAIMQSCSTWRYIYLTYSKTYLLNILGDEIEKSSLPWAYLLLYAPECTPRCIVESIVEEIPVQIPPSLRIKDAGIMSRSAGLFRAAAQEMYKSVKEEEGLERSGLEEGFYILELYVRLFTALPTGTSEIERVAKKFFMGLSESQAGMAHLVFNWMYSKARAILDKSLDPGRTRGQQRLNWERDQTMRYRHWKKAALHHPRLKYNLVSALLHHGLENFWNVYVNRGIRNNQENFDAIAKPYATGLKVGLLFEWWVYSWPIFGQ